MSQAGGFDLSRRAPASKILLGAGVLYLIDLCLPWNRACVDAGPLGDICGSAGGMAGIGILNLLLVLALIVWVGMALANVSSTAPRALSSAALAEAILRRTILNIMVDVEAIYLSASVVRLLVLAVGYGGWMRWQELHASGGPGAMKLDPPTETSGGFTS